MKNQSLFKLLLISYTTVILATLLTHLSLWALLICLPFTLGVCVFVAKRITTPLDALQDIIEKMTQDEYQHQFPWSESFEIKELVGRLHSLDKHLVQKMSQLLSEIHQKEGILESMTDGVITLDLNERIIGVNKAATHYLEISEDKLLGFALHAAVRNTDFQKFVTQLYQTQDKHLSYTVITDLQNRQLQMQGTLIQQDGSIIGALLVLHDLSPLKQLDAIRKDFVANVSHELKTPITLIQGSLETLDSPDLTPEEQQKFIQVALSHSQRLGHIIEDLLTLARLEQGQHSIELTPIQPLISIQKAVSLCQAQLDEANITVSMGSTSEEALLINAPLFEQAFLNLIQNAAKYSEASNLSITMYDTETHCVFLIQDNGKGIPAEHLPRLFERFYRVDPARQRQSGGTGLGLSIVKHIVMAHHGKIEVASTLGQGTTFTLMFPKISTEKETT
jgi:two-component system phosphate regulon sensor histidine kinase PhoR